MDEQARTELRTEVNQRRKPPERAHRIRIKPDDRGLFPETIENGRSIELAIEATIDQREITPWYCDEWWTEVIAYLADLDLMVNYLPTPGALIHPVVLHHVNMLRRVVPHWRVVGHAYRNDILTDHDVDLLANSLFHEVRFIDAPRPGSPKVDRGFTDRPIEDLFGRMRRATRMPATPVLVREAVENADPARVPAGSEVPVAHGAKSRAGS